MNTTLKETKLMTAEAAVKGEENTNVLTWT